VVSVSEFSAMCNWQVVGVQVVNEALLQVAGHSDWCHGQVVVQCTHVPASVYKFCSQPDCLADTNLER